MKIYKERKKRFRVDMAPLIDVVFLLLIFFMLTFAMQGQGMDLSLPKSSADANQEENSLVIKIGKGNSIQVDSNPIPFDKLYSQLNEMMQGRHNKMVVIESDKNARYGLFAQVLDVARQAGVKDFSIVRDVE